jgi:hypothetical protein
LIFSSAYANNPASAFGHTFIRFNQEGNSHDLLNYAAAYSAFIESNDNGFVYAFKGMTGGYPGTFSLEPYYMKVASYNDHEGRDLVEYQLDFTQEEVNFLVKHLWELYATAVFPYRFLDRNCSSVLGAYLEVVDPSLKLAKPKWWYYLPSELILRLEESGRIKKIIFRPSLKKQIEQQWERNSKIEQKVIKDEFFESSEENYLTSEQLDILLKLSEFRRIDKKNELSMAEVEQEKKWLFKRSQFQVTNRAQKKAQESPSYNRPELSHAYRKIHIGQSKVGRENFLSIKFFNGHHDLLDNDLGHEPFSHFSFINPSISHNFETKKWSWKNSDFIHITSMPAWRFYHKQLAWKIRSGVEEVSYLHPESEKLALSGGAGVAIDLNRKILHFLSVPIMTYYFQS